MKYLGSFILVSLACQHLSAQDSSSTGLDPVTITASYSPVQASKTGRNLVVLNGAQFQQLPVHSLDELLRYVPGVEVQARGPMGAQSDIVLRGGTYQQVLVILDGIKLNDPLTGHFSSYIPIAPAEIDRIEVLKGASSAIYGTEAVGGVIHIITKSFSNKKSNQLQAQAGMGEYGFWNVQAGGMLKTEKGVLAAGVQTNQADGQPQRGIDGYLNLTTASASYRHNINNNWHIAARTAYDYRDFAAQNFYTTFASDTAVERVKTWWNHVQTGYSTEGFQWRFDVGYKTVDDRYAFNKRTSPNQNNSSVLQLLSVADIVLGKKSSLTTGVQYISKKIESNDRGNHTVWQTGLFGIWHQQLGNYLNIEPAIRFDYNERGGFELVPQVNASYRRSFYQLRGSVGRTIRDADFTERFNNYNKPLVLSGSIGNPDLSAETSWSYELGADAWLGKHFKVAATYFSRQQSDLIDFVPTPYADMPRKDNLVPTGNYALAKNIAEVATNGFETDLTYLHAFSSKQRLQATLGFVWLDSDSNGEEPGFYISSHAKFLTNFSAIYQCGRITASVNGLYKKRTERKAAAINAEVTPDYFVLNTKLECRVFKNFSAYIQADNILDETYSDLLGSVMPGRWIMGGIKWQISHQ
ncbi:MAG TPA: TonB-dependent receptor [Phnomibacter sp.]|nr:TonB-dependent receptor [Phnomibacter sp.]